MNRPSIRLRHRPAMAAAAVLLAACVAQAPKAPPPPPTSGIGPQRLDAAVRPQDDFYQYANGGWLRDTPMPDDKPVWGGTYTLDDRAYRALGEILDAAAADKAKAGSQQRKIGDLYASFMDQAHVDALGLSPLKGVFQRIDSLKSKKELPELIAALERIGVGTPYFSDVAPDRGDPTHYLVSLDQGGLGLPDRDDYLNTRDAQRREVLDQYHFHVETMLGMTGDRNATADARAILALETALARLQWSKLEERDPGKTYNKQPLAMLVRGAPGYDWKAYLAAAGIAGRTDAVNLSQPSYLKGFAAIAAATPLETWKAYFRWHALAAFAPYLSKPFVDQDFAFYGTVVRGVPQNPPRWRRGVDLVDDCLGQALGQAYVARYFPPQSKARVQALAAHLLAAFRRDLASLDWMAPQTRTQALARLDRLTIQIGYPDHWRDYGKLSIARDDLVGNLIRARAFEYQRKLDQLGKPVDRSQWNTMPQTVRAYYRDDLNQIVLPAAILQPPMFDPAADEAANYGAIGVTIGRQISHAFDDGGGRFDTEGKPRNGWTDQDRKRFHARTDGLVAQYGRHAPLPGHPIDGKLTLGENIGDTAGLAIAYKAYRLSLGGKPAPVIDGLGGDQRFFLGFAQSWCVKVRQAEALRRIKTDPYAPPQFRVDLPLMNLDAFYAAYDVKPGDGMYLPPDRRVSVW